MSKSKVLLAISLLVSLLSFDVLAQSSQNGLLIQSFKINNEQYQLEIAQTPMQLSIGLMGRNQLDDLKGMLFIFPTLEQHGIWMKNMNIALTVAWLDKDFKVIDVKKITPCIEPFCPVFKSSRPSKFVLELNIRDKIKIGDQVYVRN